MIQIDGQPWFVAADVCKVLELSNVTMAMKTLSQDEKSLNRIEGFRGSHINCITESGLYKLVMRSDKPQARKFQDWVTRDVLPAIRKDGMYVAGEEKVKTGIGISYPVTPPHHTINEEPRILDTDLAERLGLSRPRDIRSKIIPTNLDELQRYGELRPTGAVSQKRGPKAKVYYLNEGQALLVCMFSRTERAADVRQQVIETFMAVRHGLMTNTLIVASAEITELHRYGNHPRKLLQIVHRTAEAFDRSVGLGSISIGINRHLAGIPAWQMFWCGEPKPRHFEGYALKPPSSASPVARA